MPDSKAVVYHQNEHYFIAEEGCTFFGLANVGLPAEVPWRVWSGGLDVRMFEWRRGWCVCPGKWSGKLVGPWE